MKASPPKFLMFFAMLLIPAFVSASDHPALEIIKRNGLQNWRALNAKLFLSDTGLKVLAEKEKPRPVVKIGEMKATSSFAFEVSLKITNPGTVGVAWIQTRENGASRRRAVFKKLKPKDGYQSVTLKIPVVGRASDFELLTPWGDSVIEKITFAGAGNNRDLLFVDK